MDDTLQTSGAPRDTDSVVEPEPTDTGDPIAAVVEDSGAGDCDCDPTDPVPIVEPEPADTGDPIVESSGMPARRPLERPDGGSRVIPRLPDGRLILGPFLSGHGAFHNRGMVEPEQDEESTGDRSPVKGDG